MATPVEVQGTYTQGTEAKIRNPLGVVALSFVTLGIYFVFWYYFVNKEMATVGRARNSDELGDSPGTSVLAVTLGALIIVPAFISLYNAWKRLNSGERLTGLSGLEPGLGLLLWIFISPVAQYIFQSSWNKVLEAQAGAPAPVMQSAQRLAPEPPPLPVK
jgi:Domain of unknown function (DUF4234)